MKRSALVVLFVLLLTPAWPAFGAAQQTQSASPNFDSIAGRALTAMRARADELKVQGVAVVAYFEGDTIQSWSSKMIVVGSYRKEPTATDKGTNLLAAVYAKASEMADTHKDSGSKVRDVMTGEVGWKGGVIARGRNGYLIAAFSGGKDEDDLQVSHAGLLKLQDGL